MQHIAMTNDDATNQQDSDGAAGWACVRLLALVRVAAERAAEIQQQLRGFEPAVLHDEGASALSAGEADRLVATVDALHDATDVLGFVAASLRNRDDALVVGAGEVQQAARDALAQGSIDASLVVLAAGLLDSADGFPALADALTNEPAAVASWGDLTVRDLLTTFHDSDVRLARRVCHAALVHPDAPIAGLDHAAVQRLAEALRAAHA